MCASYSGFDNKKVVISFGFGRSLAHIHTQNAVRGHFSALLRFLSLLSDNVSAVAWPHPMLFRHHVWLSNCNMLCGNLLKVITVWISNIESNFNTLTRSWRFGKNQIKVSVLRATSTTSWQQVLSSSSARQNICHSSYCMRISVAFGIHNFWLYLCGNRVCVEYEMIYLWLLPILLLSICLTSIWTQPTTITKTCCWSNKKIFSLVHFFSFLFVELFIFVGCVDEFSVFYNKTKCVQTFNEWQLLKWMGKKHYNKYAMHSNNSIKHINQILAL